MHPNEYFALFTKSLPASARKMTSTEILLWTFIVFLPTIVFFMVTRHSDMRLSNEKLAKIQDKIPQGQNFPEADHHEVFRARSVQDRSRYFELFDGSIDDYRKTRAHRASTGKPTKEAKGSTKDGEGRGQKIVQDGSQKSASFKPLELSLKDTKEKLADAEAALEGFMLAVESAKLDISKINMEGAVIFTFPDSIEVSSSAALKNFCLMQDAVAKIMGDLVQTALDVQKAQYETTVGDMREIQQSTPDLHKAHYRAMSQAMSKHDSAASPTSEYDAKGDERVELDSDEWKMDPEMYHDPEFKAPLETVTRPPAAKSFHMDAPVFQPTFAAAHIVSGKSTIATVPILTNTPNTSPHHTASTSAKATLEANSRSASVALSTAKPSKATTSTPTLAVPKVSLTLSSPTISTPKTPAKEEVTITRGVPAPPPEHVDEYCVPCGKTIRYEAVPSFLKPSQKVVFKDVHERDCHARCSRCRKVVGGGEYVEMPNGQMKFDYSAHNLVCTAGRKGDTPRRGQALMGLHSNTLGRTPGFAIVGGRDNIQNGGSRLAAAPGYGDNAPHSFGRTSFSKAHGSTKAFSPAAGRENSAPPPTPGGWGSQTNYQSASASSTQAKKHEKKGGLMGQMPAKYL